MPSNFIHLHCHSDYSLLDGMATIPGYVKRCKELGMDAVALTDHGNMFGAIEFYNACVKEKIKPIVGCEFYHTRDRASRDPENKYWHLILLAMDEEGYHQLMKLQTVAWTEGKWYKPRIDDRALEENSSHLICLSACIAGEIPRLILQDKLQEAAERVQWFKNLFGDRYYIEVQNHGLPEERIVYPHLVELSERFGIPLVATNDVHYINIDDWDAHDTLLCIGTQAQKNDTNRLRYKEKEFYLRSESEMRALFPDHPEAISNTRIIADRCKLELHLPGPILPKCHIPEGYKDDGEYLTALAYEGLKRRYPDADAEYMKTLEKRLQYELDIIKKMDFPAYFLIVQDYINWAKDHDIAVGPGRGSGAGSLVAYSIRITNVDPMKYDLLFERFLNPDRVSMPDFDIDFCYERRGEVIDYVSEHYGKDHVGQISTFGTLKAKAVLKDVARVFGVSPADSNHMSSLVPEEIPGKKVVTLGDAIEAVPELKALASDWKYQTMFEHALKLEGLNRQSSLHAAGVVIGREPLDHYVPLLTDKTGAVASQISSPTIEECGLVKMDFLGLKTLTLIRHAQELIRLREPDFDIEKAPEDDKATFQMLSSGDSSCVFQFESQGMQAVLMKAQPGSIDELAALNALYRPGPMQFIDRYVDAKFGRIPIKYPDPCLEQYLKSTYGVIVFQEQVMQVAQRIAGYSLGQADELRRIMGKKKVEKMTAELVKFKEGAVKNGFTAEHAEEIFHILEPFAGYGFNKAHAVAYAVVAYQTAYLKAHYPVEFMAANLTNEVGNPDKFSEYLSLVPAWGLKIVPPSINDSLSMFSVHDGTIVYGFEAIRNVGRAVSEVIVEEREKHGPYSSMQDFIKRQPSPVGSRVLEALIKSGCFDSLGEERGMLLANLKDVLSYDKKRRIRNEKEEGQMTLLDLDSMDEDYEMQPAEAIPWLEKLRMEKEFLGFYVSGHPTDAYSEIIDTCVCVDLSDPSTIPLSKTVSIVAEVADFQRRFSKKTGKPFGILTVSTKEGSMEIFMSGDIYDQYQGSALLLKGTVIGIVGKYYRSRKDDSIRFSVQDLCVPTSLVAKAVSIIHVRFPALIRKHEISQTFAMLKDQSSATGIDVYFSMEDDPWHEMRLPFKLPPEAVNLAEIRKMPGVRKAWTE